MVLSDLGRYAEALDLNARALALYREKRDEKHIAAVLNNIGVTHKNQGRYDEALRRHEESLDITRKLGNQAGIATTLNNIGKVYSQRAGMTTPYESTMNRSISTENSETKPESQRCSTTSA
jgi:tetratricopeptide (TPR) repeat protein